MIGDLYLIGVYVNVPLFFIEILAKMTEEQRNDTTSQK